MKLRLLYYSDCSFFAGCENMIANFLNSDLITNNFCVSFAYNYNKEYEQGFNNRVFSSQFSTYPLKLKGQPKYNRPDGYPLIFVWMHKAIWTAYFILNKYWSIGVNTILLYRFYKKNNFDILHINNGGYPGASSCYAAVIAGRILGIKKIVYVVNNIASGYNHPSRWFDYPIDYFVKLWVTIFITGSEHAGKRLRKVMNLNINKHLTINNGIKRRAITINNEAFREKYFIPKNKIVASVIANLEKRKGHIFLFEAIVKIKMKYQYNLCPYFVIEGTGPEKWSLENFIIENDLEKFILMIDFIPDIFNLINASDFIILPSIASEDFPNVILESMSLGKPVIGTEIAGIPEQIENNKTGIFVKPKNSDELEHAIMLLATNPSLLQQFSIPAKCRFDKLFEESISVEKYYNLYKLL